MKYPVAHGILHPTTNTCFIHFIHPICGQVETQLSSNEAVCGQELLDTRPWARALGVGVEAQQMTPVTLTNSGE